MEMMNHSVSENYRAHNCGWFWLNRFTSVFFFFFSFLIFIIVLLPCYIPLVGNTNSGRSLAGTLNSYGLRQPINSHGSAVPRLQRPGRDAGYAWKISCFFFFFCVSILLVSCTGMVSRIQIWQWRFNPTRVDRADESNTT